MSEMVDMVLRDHKRMRSAGTALAEAALYTIREYDGLHRLALAVADWSKAVADEGDRSRHALTADEQAAFHQAHLASVEIVDAPPADAAAQEQIAWLTAENDRLREALKTIVAGDREDLESGGYVEFPRSEEECREIAYSALHPTPGGPHG